LDQELIGLAIAVGRLTLALKQTEKERDALAAELEQLKAASEAEKE
jgi:hypothetical protein